MTGYISTENDIAGYFVPKEREQMAALKYYIGHSATTRMLYSHAQFPFFV